ncbi:MAG: NAD-dependent malic enzyme [Syntrophus sp. (in: bacteria)]
MIRTTSASYSILIRMELNNKPGMLGRVVSAIGKAGGNLGAVDIVGFKGNCIIRDIVVSTADHDMMQKILDVVKRIDGVNVIDIADRTFLAHVGGKIEIKSKIPLNSRDDLAMAYTPGVARICEAIHEDPERAHDLTIKKNCIAIVSDGTAVLGLGDIGPKAAMPVMEGKVLLFKNFGGVDAFPICLDTKVPDEIIETVVRIAPGFGGINLEDISAPRCFEVENRLKEILDIPVFHDDQHGTAVVILAGLLNALKITGKDIKDILVVVNGLGAAGIAAINLLRAAGATRFIGCDRKGILYRGRKENMNPIKEKVAEETNHELIKGDVFRALKGADLFLGVSEGNLLHAKDVKKMAKDPIVFAMANPTPEIMPEEAQRHVRIMATGRSDYPNQINNVLCFPGLFRGVLDCHARVINREMLLAAARAIADSVEPECLMEDYIIPSVFNLKVQEKVAAAVRETAVKTGVAREMHEFSLF